MLPRSSSTLPGTLVVMCCQMSVDTKEPEETGACSMMATVGRGVGSREQATKKRARTSERFIRPSEQTPSLAAVWTGERTVPQ